MDKPSASCGYGGAKGQVHFRSVGQKWAVVTWISVPRLADVPRGTFAQTKGFFTQSFKV